LGGLDSLDLPLLLSLSEQLVAAAVSVEQLQQTLPAADRSKKAGQTKRVVARLLFKNFYHF